jgi:uncharacterized protein (DUF934 family)
MRRIIKSRQIIVDPWQSIGDDEVLPEAPVIVTLTRWQRDREQLLAHDQGIGVRLTNDTDPQEIAADLDYFQVIALEFPIFRDGRAYSQARLLRERYGYRGELRAVGDVLRDQLFFMYRSGFDAFELRADRDIEDALQAFTEFTVTYQAAVDEPRPLYRRGR